EFGADFGGPIVKNKVFFFLAYESIRQHQAITVASVVPSQDDRATASSAAAVQSLLTLIPIANTQLTPSATHDLPGQPNTWTGSTGATLANVSINQRSADIDAELHQQDRLPGYYVVQKNLRHVPTA